VVISVKRVEITPHPTCSAQLFGPDREHLELNKRISVNYKNPIIILNGCMIVPIDNLIIQPDSIYFPIFKNPLS
jgi:hypothetical protein